MNSIYKYLLDKSRVVIVAGARTRFALAMPRHSKILTAQEQGGGVVIWALVNKEAAVCTRYIDAYATGQDVDVAGKEYVGTVQVGAMVWHVFAEGEK